MRIDKAVFISGLEVALPIRQVNWGYLLVPAYFYYLTFICPIKYLFLKVQFVVDESTININLDALIHQGVSNVQLT